MALLSSAAPPPRLAVEPGRRRPLISLTPLIDVVFILLIFFMLASSFLDWRAIDLTAPGHAGASPSMDGALLVEVRPEGLRLGGQRVSLASLTGKVRARLAQQPNQKVLVKPSAGVPL